jgi:hypothetical protein
MAQVLYFLEDNLGVQGVFVQWWHWHLKMDVPWGEECANLALNRTISFGRDKPALRNFLSHGPNLVLHKTRPFVVVVVFSTFSVY